MFFEVGSIIIATILSFTGAAAPALIADSGAFTPLQGAACSTYNADSCLESDVCDVFIASSGGESCALACDLRDVASCTIDGECQVVNGICDYPGDDAIGC